jgi:hypothetical protein
MDIISMHRDFMIYESEILRSKVITIVALENFGLYDLYQINKDLKGTNPKTKIKFRTTYNNLNSSL